MTEATVQASFNSGEWSPNLFARVDMQKYKSGAALLENFFIDYRGGASTRPGTKYVIQAYISSTQVRVINFQASFTVGYALEFGNGYIRFIYQGAPVVEATVAITNATQAANCVLTIPGHTYIIGNWIFVQAVNGMTQLNNRYFSVLNVAGNLVTIGDLNGGSINSTGYSAYTSGGTSARIYTIASPYVSTDDFRLIKYAQSTNQMILCHPNHPVQVLTLISATNWTIVPMVTGATIAAPTGVVVTTTIAGAGWSYSYVVTAIDSKGQESTQSVGGTLTAQSLRLVAGSNVINWNPVAGAVAYNIYEAIISNAGTVPAGSQYGFIGSALSTTFVDSNIGPNFSQTPQLNQTPFSVNGNPTVPGFVQQRLVLAGQTNTPATFYMSQPGQYFNFNITNPVIASNAVSGTLVSGALNNIKSIVGSSAGMIILTDKASWVVNGGSSGSAITPISIVANPQSFVGANDVPPIVANYDILYVQAKGSAVRDLAFNIYFSVFTGTDISIMASHLFYGFSIMEWAWAEQPYYLAQAVRNDGLLLSLTFLKEQEFVGWTHYTTLGTYESVCSVTETLSSGGSVDAVYCVTRRTVNGNVLRYIERFAERSFPLGVISAWCVDAGLQYSGGATTNFQGAEHLAGLTVTGLADGNVITPFTMPVSGQFTLPVAASVVTIGIGYTCKLQTLPLDLGEPTVQGKVKKIMSVDIRVKDALGLSIGSSFSTLVPMKDLVIGNVSSTLTGQPSQVITGLVSGDAQTFLDPTYTVPGQYAIQQSLPLPATVLGVFPRIVTEDRR